MDELNDTTEDIFDRYLDGTLPEAEKEALELRFRTDAALLEAFRQHRALVESLQKNTETLLRERVTQARREVFGESWKPPRKPMRFWLAIALAALMIALAGYWIFTVLKNGEEPGQEQRQATPVTAENSPATGLEVGQAGRFKIRFDTVLVSVSEGSRSLRLTVQDDPGAVHEREYVCSDTLLQIFIRRPEDTFWEKPLVLSGIPPKLYLQIDQQKFLIQTDHSSHELIK